LQEQKSCFDTGRVISATVSLPKCVLTSRAIALPDTRDRFTMGTGGHYITMLTADWSISTSHDPLPSSCHSKKMLWNPSHVYWMEEAKERCEHFD